MAQPRIYNWQEPTNVMIGGASGDDPLWTSTSTLDQVRSLIERPNEWVDALPTSDNRKIELLSPFTMKIRLLRPEFALTQTRYVVQGIDGTALITIRPVLSADLFDFDEDHPRFESGLDVPPDRGLTDPWLRHWQRWAHPDIKLHVAKANGVGFGHLDLFEDGDGDDDRADKIAAFLIRSALAYSRNDGGPWLNMILQKSPAQLAPEVSLEFEAVEPGPPAFNLVTQDDVRRVQFTYIGEFGNEKPACDNMSGYIDASSGKIGLDDVTIKSYKAS